MEHLISIKHSKWPRLKKMDNIPDKKWKKVKNLNYNIY